eukprot:SAG11_NODE_2308_length_3545_cov_2.767557_1_plen_83_part_00
MNTTNVLSLRFCSDIDILLSHVDGISHAKLIAALQRRLVALGYLIDTLSFDAEKLSDPKTRKDALRHTRTESVNGQKLMGAP